MRSQSDGINKYFLSLRKKAIVENLFKEKFVPFYHDRFTYRYLPLDFSIGITHLSQVNQILLLDLNFSNQAYPVLKGKILINKNSCG